MLAFVLAFLIPHAGAETLYYITWGHSTGVIPKPRSAAELKVIYRGLDAAYARDVAARGALLGTPFVQHFDLRSTADAADGTPRVIIEKRVISLLARPVEGAAELKQVTLKLTDGTEAFSEDVTVPAAWVRFVRLSRSTAIVTLDPRVERTVRDAESRHRVPRLNVGATLLFQSRDADQLPAQAELAAGELRRWLANTTATPLARFNHLCQRALNAVKGKK